MDAPAPKLAASLANGLAYLAAAQRPDGGFDSFSSPSSIHFEKAFTYQTTFAPALILAAVADLQTAPARRLKRRLAVFITAQRSPAWSFNYWAAHSPERRTYPYPDDLDDTCCALIALQRHRPDGLGPAALAAAVKLLLAVETQPGGPYRTWLAGDDAPAAWQDVDLAVNANVAYLLSLVSEPLPNLTALMERAIRDEQFVSPYYPSAYPVLYYLARTYRGPLVAKLRGIVRRLAREAEKLSPLQTALLLTSLLRLGGRADSCVAARLIEAQATDGSWQAEAFCLDPAQSGITYYSGSQALTTAFALESLHIYRDASSLTRNAVTGRGTSGRTAAQADAAFRMAVLSSVPQDMEQSGTELCQAMVGFANRLGSSSNGTEIMALPLQFSRSLQRPLPQTAGPMLLQLGRANLYGWAAYTIYDDFLDDEGQPGLLPVATAALRYSLAAFDKARPEDRAFRRLVRQTFDTIDSANAWEVSHCRFRRAGRQLVIKALPDYGEPVRLAGRSLGHALTPLAVLRASGAAVDSDTFRQLQQAIIHYLTARQLNDDAHDWQIDLRNGHITYVVARLLADEEVRPGRYGLDGLVQRLQPRFWHRTLPDICRLMQAQTALGRRQLQRLSGLQPHNVLSELLDGIDASVAETLATQDRAQRFLKHYKHRQAVKV